MRDRPQGPAHVEGAAPGPKGAWLVQYETGGQQLTDYWYYIHQRWEFDLLLSNPGAARLYRLPFVKYAAPVGCQDLAGVRRRADRAGLRARSLCLPCA
jgi:hypothetical protein